METAVLVWNGTSVTGNTDIQSFLEKLPPSEHQIISLDAQPLHGKFQFLYTYHLMIIVRCLFIQRRQLRGKVL